MRRTITTLLLIAACVYGFACAALAVFQRSFIYFPQPAYPTGLAVTQRLPIADATVLATVHEHAGATAVIYFGGNGDAAALQMPSLVEAFPDTAIFALNYRGYGGSSGQPTEAALQADALVLFDDVRARHADVIVVGRSLGSGIAIRLAALRPVKSLVLVTPYSSIEELAQHRFPVIPVHWLLVDKYESWRHAPEVRAPTLLIAAQNDQVVPRWSTEELLARFRPGLARLAVIPEVGHGSIVLSREYLHLLQEVAPHERAAPLALKKR